MSPRPPLRQRVLSARGAGPALPTHGDSAALDVARGYFRRSGTHTATYVLGSPPLTKDTADGAEFSNMLLNSAALCESVLELADEHRHR